MDSFSGHLEQMINENNDGSTIETVGSKLKGKLTTQQVLQAYMTMGKQIQSLACSFGGLMESASLNRTLEAELKQIVNSATSVIATASRLLEGNK